MSPATDPVALLHEVLDVLGHQLWAGGPKSTSDVVGLLEANPDADLAAVDDVCARFDLSAAWQALRPRRP